MNAAGSEPPAPAEPAADEQHDDGPPARPEGLFGALVVVVLLMLVFGVAVAVLGLRVQTTDVVSLYESTLPGDEPLPLGLVFSGGTAMAGEQRWFVLEREAAGEGADPHPDWPVKVAIGRFGNALPARRLFAPTRENLPRDLSKELERWERDPYRFEAVTRRGAVAFGTRETDFLVERHFEPDGSFFDLIRVDLTVGNTGGVLEAHWPRGSEAADVETLVPLLERVDLPEPEEGGPPVPDGLAPTGS